MEDFIEPVHAALKAVLGDDAADPRRRGLTAAVLVRNNTFGRLLADGLKARGFGGVVWEGESNVLSTPALAGFLDLVQLADHPGDMPVYRHFSMTPLAAAKYPGGVPAAAEISREMSMAFTTRGLVRTFRELRALFPEDPDEAWSRFTEERFTDMLRAAADFERTAFPDTRLSDFPAFLAAQKRRTVAEDGAVKIMTIHRSKGLGFDYVVLPLYEHDPLSSEPDGPLVGDGWVLPSLDPRTMRAVPGLSEAFRARKDRAEQEELCTYYVAMTRAKKAMTVVLHPEGRSLRFSDLVRSASLGDLANPSTVLECPAASGAGNAVPRPLPPPARAPRRPVRRRLPSLGCETGVSAGSLFATDRGASARARGIEAHARMEKIEFSEELPKYDGFVALWREKPFEVFADGEWVSGRFDRVTFFVKEGELCAEVVDFKPSAQNAERYRRQLSAYSKAVSALAGIPESRISTRIVAWRSE